MTSQVDFTSIVTHLRERDSLLSSVIDRVGPCRIGRGAGGLPALVNSVVGQQLSTSSAGAIRSRLYGLLGGNDIDAKHLAGFSEEELRTTGLSRAKTACLKSLAEHILTGQIDFQKLEDQDDETVISTLTRVKGIGRWTAEMYLMFSLGRLDVFPVDDQSIRNAIICLYEIPVAEFKTRVIKISEEWRPYRTVASWYLYRYLDLPPDAGL